MHEPRIVETVPPTIRVLFVDDEPSITEGLRDVLWKHRDRFEVRVASGGAQALALLAAREVDILVTDVLMPEMNGLQLLEQVRNAHPEVVRISLSGYAQDDLVARSSAVAHQQLGKPVDAVSLRAALEKAGSFHRLLASGPLRRVIGSLGQVPSAPAGYAELTRALADPSVDFVKLARLLEKDLGTAARVLKLVNSAYYGPARTVGDLETAIARLGLAVMRHIVLTVDVEKHFPGAIPGWPPGTLERHSVLCARLARRLAEPAAAEQAFAAGLLHDIGRVVLASRLPRQYLQLVEAATRAGTPVHQGEREGLGADHAEVGGYLLGLWGMEPEIVEAVLRHHDAAAFPEAGRTGLGVVDAVRVAHALAGSTAGPSPPGSAAEAAGGALSAWAPLVREELARADAS